MSAPFQSPLVQATGLCSDLYVQQQATAQVRNDLALTQRAAPTPLVHPARFEVGRFNNIDGAQMNIEVNQSNPMTPTNYYKEAER